MSRSSILIVASPMLALAVASCMRDDGQASTTTIRSGTSEPFVADVEPATRLATELCRREARCSDGEQRRTDEAKLLAEQNCVTVWTARTQNAMGSWECSPAMARAGYEECLAAIRTKRCETELSSLNDVLRCRSNMVCRHQSQ